MNLKVRNVSRQVVLAPKFFLTQVSLHCEKRVFTVAVVVVVVREKRENFIKEIQIISSLAAPVPEPRTMFEMEEGEAAARDRTGKVVIVSLGLASTLLFLAIVLLILHLIRLLARQAPDPSPA